MILKKLFGLISPIRHINLISHISPIRQQRTINLTVPRSWNQCNLRQLRAIARELVEAAQRENRYLPMDLLEVKVRVFFALAGLEIVERVLDDDGEHGFLVYQQPTTWKGRLRKFFGKLVSPSWGGGWEEAFPLYDWQLHSWLNEDYNSDGKRIRGGLLDWMNADHPDQLLMFPFPTLRIRGCKFQGPEALMNGFTWQRYRFLQDYMELYAKQMNRVLHLQRMGRKVVLKDIATAASQLMETRSMILAIIFTTKDVYVEDGKKQRDYRWNADMMAANSKYFRNYSEVDFQLVLLWWQGQMAWLHKTYPKVFKEQNPNPKKKQNAPNPLELYSRTTATLEKYLHITAKEVDAEPYTTVLQQLNDIVTSNEELEKINKK